MHRAMVPCCILSVASSVNTSGTLTTFSLAFAMHTSILYMSRSTGNIHPSTPAASRHSSNNARWRALFLKSVIPRFSGHGLPVTSFTKAGRCTTGFGYEAKATSNGATKVSARVVFKVCRTPSYSQLGSTNAKTSCCDGLHLLVWYVHKSLSTGTTHEPYFSRSPSMSPSTQSSKR